MLLGFVAVDVAVAVAVVVEVSSASAAASSVAAAFGVAAFVAVAAVVAAAVAVSVSVLVPVSVVDVGRDAERTPAKRHPRRTTKAPCHHRQDFVDSRMCKTQPKAAVSGRLSLSHCRRNAISLCEVFVKP